MAGIVGGAVRVVGEVRPDVVLVLGDTHTVPAYCLAARNATVPAVHLEAGLRSFNPTSVEEVNRRVAAATCALHLAPTELARRFLRAEGVPAERIAVVGNPVLDALRAVGATRRPPHERRGVLVTAHRATNVDDPARLAELVALVRELAATIGPVTFPMHPRTRASLRRHGLLARARPGPGSRSSTRCPTPRWCAWSPAATVVVTDSGGLQEEASWLGVPVVVLRRSTPRWESVHNGSAVLTGLDAARAAKAALQLSAPDAQLRIADARLPVRRRPHRPAGGRRAARAGHARRCWSWPNPTSSTAGRRHDPGPRRARRPRRHALPAGRVPRRWPGSRWPSAAPGWAWTGIGCTPR